MISAIVAMAEDNVIGANNDIPWYLPADLMYFKKTTTGHPIIMGRNSFESIGRPLPKRTNIIITRNPFFAVSNALVAHSLNEALSLAYETGTDECFIIGGGQIYTMAMPLVDKLYITEVHAKVEGTVFFPEVKEDEWLAVSEEFHEADEKNEFPYTFKIYTRI